MKKKKNESKKYFMQEHEDAIIKYCETNDRDEKERLYIDLIQPAFDEMVDKIVYTYKFTGLANIDRLKEDCKIHLTTLLKKYDPNKKNQQGKRPKAFSYFSVITKHWFIHKYKKLAKQAGREVSLEEIMSAHNVGHTGDYTITNKAGIYGSFEKDYLSTTNGFFEKQEDKEFWDAFWEEFETWEDLYSRTNEEKVIKAVKILFESVDDIEIFNKKAIYLYMREITGLNTKQVVGVLNKVRSKYREFRKQWENGEV